MPQYELEGQLYHLNNGNWYGEDHIQVPSVISSQLNKKYVKKNNRRNIGWIHVLPGCVGAGKRR